MTSVWKPFSPNILLNYAGIIQEPGLCVLLWWWHHVDSTGEAISEYKKDGSDEDYIQKMYSHALNIHQEKQN